MQSKSVCGGSQEQWVRELVNCFELKGESLVCPPGGHQAAGCPLTVSFASATQHFTIWNLLTFTEELSLQSVFPNITYCHLPGFGRFALLHML